MKNYCNYFSLDKEICYICDNEYMYFLSRPNVVGVGLGYRIKNGFNTFQKCITVFVNRKLGINYLSKHQLIPKSYKGIKTDVIESGEIYVKSLHDRVRPVEGGYSIGVEGKISQGTVGCLVRDKKNNLYVLSNNHVLAFDNFFPLGINIVQPAQKFHVEPNIDVIGTLSKFISLKPKNRFYYPTNYVDCAIGKVTDSSLVSSKIALIGNIMGVKTNIALNEPIKKVGCTTELTTGTVTNTNVTVYINYFVGRCLFKKQIMCECIAEGGDSGSMVLDANNNVIGLLMAGTSGKIGVNPIKYVLDSLKVDIVL